MGVCKVASDIYLVGLNLAQEIHNDVDVHIGQLALLDMHLSKLGFSTIEELKELTERTFTVEYSIHVFIPASVTKIADDAFIGASRFTLHTPKGSEAARFAKKNPISLCYTDMPRRNRASRFFRTLGKKTTSAATGFTNIFKKER